MITETPELLADWDVVNGTTIRSKETEYEVEVGDSKQTDFYPQVKLKRFLNEFNFSIRPVLPDYTVIQLRTINNQIQCRMGIWDFRWWMGISEDDGKVRGVRFEMRLNAKPPTNTLDFTVNRKGVTLNFQPPLTQGEVDDGAIRPPPIIYSIAVYSNKQNNQYKTGKICHLYRPRLRDTDNNRVWGRWAVINQNLIQLQMPPAFLSSAVYPIRVR